MTVSRSPSCWAASVLLLVAAATHIPLIPGHLQEAPYVGVLFILLSVVAVVLAIAVLVVHTDTVWLMAGAVCFAAVLAFLASRTIGLPQMHDDMGMWTEEPLGIPAVASEALMAGLAWIHLHPRRTSTRSATATHQRRSTSS